MTARLALAASLCLLVTAAAVETQPLAPPFALDRTELVFGVRSSTRPLVTPPQHLFLESTTGGAPVVWTATADRPWLVVEPSSGRVPARLTIGVTGAVPVTGDAEGRIVITAGRGQAADHAMVRVVLKHVDGNPVPMGSIDTPAEHAVAEGSARLSGWALHPLGLSRIALCRDQAGARSARIARNDACGDRQTFIGDATVNYLKRPDVAAAFPGVPLADRAGWTYVLNADAIGAAGQGTLRVHAIATGIDGSRATIGARTFTIVPSASPPLPRTLRLILLLLFIGLAVHALFGWFCVRRLPPGGVAPACAGAPPSWIERGIVVLLVTFSLAMSLPALRSSLTYDELYLASLYAVDVPVWKAALEASTFIHIAYALAAAVSVRLLDASEFSLRLPAALFGAAAVYAVWRYARPMAGTVTALTAALILALLPFHAHWSRMAKGYTGLALTTLLALHAFAAVRRGGSRRHAVEHAAALAIGMYFHLYAVWIFLVQYATFLGLGWVSAFRPRPRPAVTRAAAVSLWWSFLAGGICAVALYAPVARGLLQPLAYFGTQSGTSSGLLEGLVTEFSGIEWVTARVAMAILGVLGGVALWRRSWVDALQLVALIVVPVAIVAGIAQPKASGARYFGYWIPVLAVLLAAGVSAVATLPPQASKSLRVAAGAGAAALLAWLSIGWGLADARVGPRDGYGEQLAPLNDSPRQRVFTVGADSEMFRYYVREPLGRFTSPDELEYALQTLPPFRVAFHGVAWNSPDDQQMHALLSRRCPGRTRAAVTIFECGGTLPPR